jgi:RimJ/RimL family protein N-acetyltransferase
MSLPLDRTHPPSRITYDDGARQLVLRPWALSDVDALVAALQASLPELRGFMPWAHGPITRDGYYEIVARFMASYWSGKEYIFGVFSAAGEVLGGTGLHQRVALNPNGLEVGYWCHSHHAGKGVTTLGVRMLTALAFDHFHCERFQVMHDEANVASRRVTEKTGFVFEGVMRHVTAEVVPEVRDGGYLGTHRHRMYALTRDDLAGLAWLPAVRASLTYHDALGGRVG